MNSHRDSRSVWEIAQARYFDANRDGRLQFSELQNILREGLADTRIAAVAEPRSVSEWSVLSLESMTTEKARRNIESLSNQLSDLFPCGVEAPNVTQLKALVELSHGTARSIRTAQANMSYGDMLEAAAQQIGISMGRTARYSYVAIETAFDGWPAPACLPKRGTALAY